MDSVPGGPGKRVHGFHCSGFKEGRRVNVTVFYHGPRPAQIRYRFSGGQRPVLELHLIGVHTGIQDLPAVRWRLVRNMEPQRHGVAAVGIGQLPDLDRCVRGLVGRVGVVELDRELCAALCHLEGSTLARGTEAPRDLVQWHPLQAAQLRHMAFRPLGDLQFRRACTGQQQQSSTLYPSAKSGIQSLLR